MQNQSDVNEPAQSRSNYLYRRQAVETWRQELNELLNHLDKQDPMVVFDGYDYIRERLIHLTNELPRVRSL